MLEVVVAPPAQDGVRLEDYPYFADFDPKKRELYELVTDTGEAMSRSLDDVGVRHGQTTSQSHEVKDTVSAGASVSAGPKGGPGASVGIESSTTDLNQRTTENVRTTDSARENRETLSHTTQLSQMYHQLNSYHLGTNRAAFFVLPRPHVVQANDKDGTPRTFVDGPRQLEGIQEFMLIVVRPKSQKHICVEAYLETAHRVQTATSAKTRTSTPLFFPKLDQNHPSNIAVSTGEAIELHAKGVVRADPPSPGYVVDKARPESDPATPGFKIDTKTEQGKVVFNVDVQDDHVTVTCEVVSIFETTLSRDSNKPASFEMNGTVYWKKVDEGQGYDESLFFTGRAVCSCKFSMPISLNYEKDLSVVYEKQLSESCRT